MIHWLLNVGAEGWSAIATAVGVIVALGLGVMDRRERRRAEERAHAEQIAAWMAPPRLDDSMGDGAVIISNASMQPVYNLAAVLVFRSGAAPHTGLDWVALGHGQTMISLIAQVPPGRYLQGLDMPEGGSPMGSGGVLLVEIAFTDRSGRHWLRNSDGGLQQLDRDAVDHYELGRPSRIRELGRAVRSDEA